MCWGRGPVLLVMPVALPTQSRTGRAALGADWQGAPRRALWRGSTGLQPRCPGTPGALQSPQTPLALCDMCVP